MRLLLGIAALLALLGTYLVGWGFLYDQLIGGWLQLSALLLGAGAWHLHRRRAGRGLLLVWLGGIVVPVPGMVAAYAAHACVAAWPRDRFGRLRSTRSAAPGPTLGQRRPAASPARSMASR